jgi:hypothetical protein
LLWVVTGDVFFLLIIDFIDFVVVLVIDCFNWADVWLWRGSGQRRNSSGLSSSGLDTRRRVGGIALVVIFVPKVTGVVAFQVHYV